MNPRVTPRAQLIAGAAIGLGATVKIWAVIPILVIVLWQFRADGVKAATRIVAGATAAIAVVCLPFFLLAPGPMFRMVVLDQLQRPVIQPSLMHRLGFMGRPNATALKPGSTEFDLTVIGLCAALFCHGVCLDLATAPGADRRGPVGGDRSSPAGESFGTLHHQKIRCRSGRPLSRTHSADRGWAAPAPVGSPRGGLPHCRAACGSRDRCLVDHLRTPGRMGESGHCAPTFLVRAYADDPSGLIAFNVLSSGPRRGCRVWSDMTGLTYDPPSGDPCRG